MKRLLLLATALTLWPLLGRAQSNDDLNTNKNPDNVAAHSMGLNRMSYSPLKSINKTNIKKLVPVWNFSLMNDAGELAAPAVYDGVLYAINGKWTFRTAADLSWLLTKEAIVPKKLSRAAVETLAVIAYHQPVTRAEVEEIRGVVMSKGTFDVLMETGWIKPRGRRKVPGRPITYGTSEDFLSHFGLEALGDLPGLEELKGSGLLDHRLPPGFAVPMPSDDPTLRDDEDPLEPGDLDLGLAPPPERQGDE